MCAAAPAHTPACRGTGLSTPGTVLVSTIAHACFQNSAGFLKACGNINQGHQAQQANLQAKLLQAQLQLYITLSFHSALAVCLTHFLLCYSDRKCL